jgi:hypothetical protein
MSLKMKNKNLFLVIGNSLAVIFTIIVNALANILPINNKYTGELSDALPNLFVPSGITFAIWGVIYVLLIVFIIYQINDLIQKQKADYIEKISIYFILASLGNIIWIFLWHYEQVVLSILPMLLLFFSLLMIYQRLEIGIKKVLLKEKIAVHVPISVYLGWITVATIANVTGALVKLNVGDLFLGEVTWTLLVIAVATIITMLILLHRKDISYSLVIIWAFLGIITKRLQPADMYGVQTNIAIFAGVGIALIVFTMVAIFFMKKNT